MNLSRELSRESQRSRRMAAELWQIAQFAIRATLTAGERP